MVDEVVQHYGKRVGYSPAELEAFHAGGHRTRHVKRLAAAAPQYSIVVEVIRSRHCNSGHVEGQQMVLDMDGNFITKLCPRKLCVYLVSQLAIPVAQINERLSAGLAPDDFHFMRRVRCPDAGVECLGFGEVMVAVRVVPRHA